MSSTDKKNPHLMVNTDQDPMQVCVHHRSVYDIEYKGKLYKGFQKEGDLMGMVGLRSPKFSIVLNSEGFSHLFAKLFNDSEEADVIKISLELFAEMMNGTHGKDVSKKS